MSGQTKTNYFPGVLGASGKVQKEEVQTVVVPGAGKNSPNSSQTERPPVLGHGVDLTQFGPNDAGNAEAVAAVIGDRLAYNAQTGFMFWNGRYYQSQGAYNTVKWATLQILKQRKIQAIEAGRRDIDAAVPLSATNVRNTIYLLQADERVNKPFDQFDNYPDYLPVANGVLNLRTGTLSPHSPKQLFTYCLNVSYRPDADQSVWLNFLGESVANPRETIPYLQKAVGHSLTGHTNEESLWYLWGPRRGGKGTFTETLLALLGRPLGMAVDFNVFTMAHRDSNSFVLATLKPARFVTAGESENSQFMNAAFIKKVTGGDYINAAFKGKDHFIYQPQFHIWLASNFPVHIDAQDDAAWGRVKVIEFPNSHYGNEDKNLKQRLREPANLEGVLAWAVQGAMRWYASPRGLVTPTSVELAGQQQRDELDDVGQFLSECTEPDPGNFVAVDPLYTAYKEFCEGNEFTPKGKGSLGKALKRKGFHKDRETLGGKQQRVWYGIRLVD